MPQLHHPEVPFRNIVLKRHREIAPEGEDAVGVIPEPIEQIPRFALRATPQAPGARRRCGAGVLGVADVHVYPLVRDCRAVLRGDGA